VLILFFIIGKKLVFPKKLYGFLEKTRCIAKKKKHVSKRHINPEKILQKPVCNSKTLTSKYNIKQSACIFSYWTTKNLSQMGENRKKLEKK